MLLSWAVDHWTTVESRTTLLTLARIDGPVSPLDLSPQHFISLIEGLIRENEARAEKLDDLYTEARPKLKDVGVSAKAQRRAEIERAQRLFGS